MKKEPFSCPVCAMKQPFSKVIFRDSVHYNMECKRCHSVLYSAKEPWPIWLNGLNGTLIIGSFYGLKHLLGVGSLPSFLFSFLLGVFYLLFVSVYTYKKTYFAVKEDKHV